MPACDSVILRPSGLLRFRRDRLVVFPQEFPNKQELHRNMLGLLGNVAEVQALRPQLMTSQFISVFR